MTKKSLTRGNLNLSVVFSYGILLYSIVKQCFRRKVFNMLVHRFPEHGYEDKNFSTRRYRQYIPRTHVHIRGHVKIAPFPIFKNSIYVRYR